MEYYCIEEKEYVVVLNECFETDSELVDKWHICAPSDVNTCVRRTYYDLKNSPSLKFYVIHCITEDTDEIAGFFGTEHIDGVRFMTSFFIKPKYRNKETLSYFWDSVEDKTGMNFITAIYAHNTRAQRFLEKNNFKLIRTLDVGEKSDALVFEKN